MIYLIPIYPILSYHFYLAELRYQTVQPAVTVQPAAAVTVQPAAAVTVQPAAAVTVQPAAAVTVQPVAAAVTVLTGQPVVQSVVTVLMEQLEAYMMGLVVWKQTGKKHYI